MEENELNEQNVVSKWEELSLTDDLLQKSSCLGFLQFSWQVETFKYEHRPALSKEKLLEL